MTRGLISVPRAELRPRLAAARERRDAPPRCRHPIWLRRPCIAVLIEDMGMSLGGEHNASVVAATELIRRFVT